MQKIIMLCWIILKINNKDQENKVKMQKLIMIKLLTKMFHQKKIFKFSFLYELKLQLIIFL